MIRSDIKRGPEEINSWSTCSNLHGKVLFNRRRGDNKASREDIQGVRFIPLLIPEVYLSGTASVDMIEEN